MLSVCFVVLIYVMTAGHTIYFRLKYLNGNKVYFTLHCTEVASRFCTGFHLVNWLTWEAGDFQLLLLRKKVVPVGKDPGAPSK